VAKAKKKTTTRKKTTSRPKKAAPKEQLVVGSKLKQAIRDQGCNTGGDVLDAVNEQVHRVLAEAVARAQNNGRKTVRSYDV